MRVLFLTPWYPDERNPNHGVFVRDQAVAISDVYDVRVVSSKIDYSAFAFSSLSRVDGQFAGVRESRLIVKRSFPVFNQFNYFLRTAVETYKIARTFKPDLIHGNIGYPGAFWAWAMSKLLSIPYVVTEHTRLTNNFRSFIHKHLTMFGMTRATRVIAVSEWHASEISDLTGKDVVVIPNVIRFEDYAVSSGALDSSEFQVGFLGGLNTPVKGLDVLLQAVTGLTRKFRLHIGGNGVLLDEYKSLAKKLNVYDDCVFYGSIPHEQVNEFMRRLHVFVSASRWETFGVAIVEALACGLPVLATDSGGPRDFMTPDNGVVVPAEDPVKLRQGLEQIAMHYSKYDRDLISSQVRDKFSKQNFVKKIQAVYADAITQSNNER